MEKKSPADPLKGAGKLVKQVEEWLDGFIHDQNAQWSHANVRRAIDRLRRAQRKIEEAQTDS